MALSESFWIFVVTTTAGLCLAGLKACYDSKCQEFSLCGITIKRDIAMEIESEMHRIEAGINDQPRVQPPESAMSVDRPAR